MLFSEAETLRLRYEKAASHQAIAKYREAISVWERQGQKQPAARAWQRVGLAYEQLGSLDETLRSYKAALALVEGSSESLLESDIRSDLGAAQSNVASQTSELEEARAQCERALALAKLAGGTAEIGKALDCRGEVAYFLQDYSRALEFYREAGTVFTTLGHDVGKALTQLHQGHVYSDLGKFEEAGACLDRAAALWAGIGDRRQQAIVRVAKARLDVRRGNYQTALNQFQEALASLEPMGDAVWEGSSLTGIALGLSGDGRNRSRSQASGTRPEALRSCGAQDLRCRSAPISATRTLRRAMIRSPCAVSNECSARRRIGHRAMEGLGAPVHRRSPPRSTTAGPGSRVPRSSLRALPRIVDDRLDRQLRADLGEAHDLLAHPEIAVSTSTRRWHGAARRPIG